MASVLVKAFPYLLRGEEFAKSRNVLDDDFVKGGSATSRIEEVCLEVTSADYLLKSVEDDIISLSLQMSVKVFVTGPPGQCRGVDHNIDSPRKSDEIFCHEVIFDQPERRCRDDEIRV